MAIFKCKMCGGSLDVVEGATTVTCEYCGSTQTIPKLADEKVARLFDRANHLRRNNEFDKATGIYEQILEENNQDSEVYWSLVLCRYGIEYVEDPATNKRIPTVNRAQFTSIFDDDNFKQALTYADDAQKEIYQCEAEAINEIQKGILEISQKEEPFDVFICYKETDSNGQRTRDSVFANDIYHQLKAEGFKVFYARITLESKLGVAYEPYIFAALNTAKIMIVIGTQPEYFNAVWVKNEWSRYLALVKSNPDKMLIPAYSGMDPYDLPQEFSHLQAQDMSKLGFMSDLVRGIKKILGGGAQKGSSSSSSGVKQTVPAMLKRTQIFLNNGDWENADAKCENILDIEPENGQAYIYKLMAYLQVSREEMIPEKSPTALDDLADFKNVLNYTNIETVERFYAYNNAIKERLAREEAERLEQERLAEEERQRMLEEEDRKRKQKEMENNLVREWKTEGGFYKLLDRLKGWIWIALVAYGIFELSDSYKFSEVNVYYFIDLFEIFIGLYWVFGLGILLDAFKPIHISIMAQVRGMETRLLARFLKRNTASEYAEPFSYYGTNWQVLFGKCKSANILLYVAEYIFRAVEIVLTMIFTKPYLEYLIRLFFRTPTSALEDMLNFADVDEFAEFVKRIIITDELIILVVSLVVLGIIRGIVKNARMKVQRTYLRNNPIADDN